MIVRYLVFAFASSRLKKPIQGSCVRREASLLTHLVHTRDLIRATIQRPCAQMDSVFSIALVKARQKKLHIQFSVRAGVADVYNGDVVRIQQICTNLIDNANKFTPVSIALQAGKEAFNESLSFLSYYTSTLADTAHHAQQDGRSVTLTVDRINKKQLEHLHDVVRVRNRIIPSVVCMAPASRISRNSFFSMEQMNRTVTYAARCVWCWFTCVL